MGFISIILARSKYFLRTGFPRCIYEAYGNRRMHSEAKAYEQETLFKKKRRIGFPTLHKKSTRQRKDSKARLNAQDLSKLFEKKFNQKVEDILSLSVFGGSNPPPCNFYL